MQTDIFEEEYWNTNYSEPHTMDCIGNAKEHVRYMRAFFGLEHIDISSIIDLGVGLGHLFQKVLKEFIPYKACGIEPSLYAFNKLKLEKLRPVESTNLTLKNETLQQWCQRADHKRNYYDLAICTSVFQYLTKEDLIFVLPILSKRIKYIYLTLPTDVELTRQKEELNFHDPYAKSRPQEFYLDLLRPHFTLISSKIWESKYYFNAETTLFSDLLYRL